MRAEHGRCVRIPDTEKLTEKGTHSNPRHCHWTRFLTLSLLASVVLVQAPLTAEFVRVKVKLANIRSGPGTRFDKIWIAPRNYPYRVVKRQGKWLKVKDFEGFEDWIYGPLTDHQPAAVVKVERANVRKGPGTSYPIRFKADIGVPFRVLGKKGNWVRVRFANGEKGWIFQKLLWGSFGTARRRKRRNQ